VIPVRGPWLAGLLAIPLACGAQAPEPTNPDQWLARMAQAGSTLEYQGVLVYAHDGRVESMRVSRSIGAKGLREEIVALNGGRRAIVRENGTVTTTDPERGTTQVGHDEFPLLTFDPSALKRAAELYRLSLVGGDRMAGLDARVLEARPTDSSRYGYRLWVEPHSGMVLGSTLQAPDGAQVEQMMFTSVAMSSAPSNVRIVPQLVPNAPTSAAIMGPSAWRLGWLPPGFRLIASPPSASELQSHLLFTDGLAYVSIYIEPLAKAAHPMDGPIKRGALNLFARPVDDSQVVVIGDVPAATAERIARGVQRTPK
jgi:sigma-E factor negative regulatory protein RseB